MLFGRRTEKSRGKNFTEDIGLAKIGWNPRLFFDMPRLAMVLYLLPAMKFYIQVHSKPNTDINSPSIGKKPSSTTLRPISCLRLPCAAKEFNSVFPIPVTKRLCLFNYRKKNARRKYKSFDCARHLLTTPWQ